VPTPSNRCARPFLLVDENGKQPPATHNQARRSRSLRVLTIARLRPGGAERTYYERTVASSQEDYYAGVGEAEGEWFGAAAAASKLGLHGTLNDGELSTLLQPRRRGRSSDTSVATRL
jgi:TrwC relaxase